jgi:uncharacterized membrane protein YkgB
MSVQSGLSPRLNLGSAESTRPRRTTVIAAVDAVLETVQSAIERYGLIALRASIGIVFLGFGVLKFFPGASPIEALVSQTWAALTFGVISGYAALAITAALEVAIGVLFLTGFWMPLGFGLLAFTFVGILSPLVLFAGELFPDGLPTLVAQYILKDVVLIVAAFVVATSTIARLRRQLRAGSEE